MLCDMKGVMMSKEDMCCPVCGKHFYSYYGSGGYIDHVTNFVGNRDVIAKSPERCLEEICFDGNYVRDNSDIKARLECFMLWDNASSHTKAIVEPKCLFAIYKIKAAKRVARELVSGMTMLERKYIVEEANNNCNIPFGDEDGKLFDGYE